MDSPDANKHRPSHREDNDKPAQGEAQWREDRSGLHWDRKTLYHGTDISGIGQFDFADESTIGNNAVYFTADRSLAAGYAQLRARERGTGKAVLYEAVVEDIDLMNWAEDPIVDKLKQKFMAYCKNIQHTVDTTDFEDFAAQYGLTQNTTKEMAKFALQRIIERCQEEDTNRGNIKSIAQGVMGAFFEQFVKDSGFDGVITVEAGDDPEFTAKPGLSVVVYDKDKITSHSETDLNAEHAE